MGTQYTEFTCKKEWLKTRTGYLTSTEIAALFNAERSGQYGKSLFELWHDKKNKTFEYIEGGNDARKGLYFEPAIAKWFADIHDLAIVPFKDFAYDDETRQGASFDYEILGGCIGDINMANAIMEIKTAKYSIYKEKWVNDMPPAYIDFQVQDQMKIAGRKMAVIVLFVDGEMAPRYWIVEACPVVHEAIDIKVAEFWKSIDDNIEPEPDFDKDSKFVISQHQCSEGVEEATEEQIAILEKYKALNAQTKATTKEMTALKAKLFRSTDAEVLTYDDCKVGLKTSKTDVRALTFKK
jgi:hypothetical protein